MEEAASEMLCTTLENAVLKAKTLNMGEPTAFLALCIDPLDLSNLERSILTLKESGALQNKDSKDISLLDGERTRTGNGQPCCGRSHCETHRARSRVERASRSYDNGCEYGSKYSSARHFKRCFNPLYWKVRMDGQFLQRSKKFHLRKVFFLTSCEINRMFLIFSHNSK